MMRIGSERAGTGASRTNRSPLVPLVQRMEAAAALDPVAGRLAEVTDRVLARPHVSATLRGGWLGHAVHPLLSDFPLGAWASTSLLDLFGGRRSRPAAEGLLAFGLAVAVPTAVTGAAEWVATTEKERRVGIIHAGLNILAIGLYGTSLLARRRGHHALGVGLGLAGGSTATVSGYLGGHLTIARKVGTSDPAFGARSESEDQS